MNIHLLRLYRPVIESLCVLRSDFWLNGQSVEEYYDKLAGDIDGKLYIYNFPDRTGYQIPADVIARLAMKHENIIGCKDTISGMDHTREIIKAIKPQRPEFEVFSGFDDNFAHNALSGSDGCIGVKSCATFPLPKVKLEDDEKLLAILRAEALV